MTCEGNPELKPGGVVEHLKTVHGLPERSKASRSIAMHLDARDFYSSAYDWQIADGAVSLSQTIIEPRHHDQRRSRALLPEV